MTGTGRVQNVITKDDIVFLFRGCQELEEKLHGNQIPIEQIFNGFKILVTQISEGKFQCPECYSDWDCLENRCTAQCGKSRQHE